ncbi:acyltransferase domain-containing protein [Actinomadura meridiana]|uniref:Acyltransferase domain-containing protein n=1 Tax=Actinomadura meridiana TaxID=559626 RepID=A0ABP8BYZ1_9ACTN
MVRTAFVVPGQGGYLPGLFAKLLDEYPKVEEVLAGVDKVARGFGCGEVSSLLSDPGAPEIGEIAAQDPATLHLAIYGTGVAAFQVLAESGIHPDLLIGHSLGEMGALAVSGMLSVEDGAVLSVRRDEALRRNSKGSGGMVALHTGYQRAHHMLRSLDSWTLAIALDNAPDQVVVSGPDDELGALLELAGVLGIQATKLPVSYPFHNGRLLSAAAEDFAASVSTVTVRHGETPVYSPVLNRYVDGVGDVEELLVGHLVRPVRFLEGIRTVHADRVRSYVECGARSICCDLVEKIVPAVRTFSPLSRQAMDKQGLDSEIGRWEQVPGRGVRETSPAAVVADPVVLLSASEPPGGRGTEPPPPAASAPDAVDEGSVLDEARRIYASGLGYPVEALLPDADLEAELGVDSVKQTELFSRLLKGYDLAVPGATPRPTDYPTLRAVARFVSDFVARQQSRGGGK